MQIFGLLWVILTEFLINFNFHNEKANVSQNHMNNLSLMDNNNFPKIWTKYATKTENFSEKSIFKSSLSIEDNKEKNIKNKLDLSVVIILENKNDNSQILKILEQKEYNDFLYDILSLKNENENAFSYANIVINDSIFQKYCNNLNKFNECSIRFVANFNSKFSISV